MRMKIFTQMFIPLGTQYGWLQVCMRRALAIFMWWMKPNPRIKVKIYQLAYECDSIESFVCSSALRTLFHSIRRCFRGWFSIWETFYFYGQEENFEMRKQTAILNGYDSFLSATELMLKRSKWNSTSSKQMETENATDRSAFLRIQLQFPHSIASRLLRVHR